MRQYVGQAADGGCKVHGNNAGLNEEQTDVSMVFD